LLCSRRVCTICLNVLDSSVVAPTLPIPQHGLLKDPPSFVAICTPQGLAVKATCMQDCCTSIPPARINQELLCFQPSTVDLCTAWRLDPKAFAILPGFCIAVHLLSVLKAWLVQGPA
jgi:hypothetical protein